MACKKGMSLDVDGIQVENGKTEYATARNSKGWMQRRRPNDGSVLCQNE